MDIRIIKYITGSWSIFQFFVATFELVMALITGQETTIGSFTIPLSVWFGLSLTGLIFSIGLFWSVLTHRKVKYLYRCLCASGRFLNAIEEYDNSNKSFDTACERLCFKLDKLNITPLCPIPNNNWFKFIDLMRAYAMDGRLKEARNHNIGGRIWQLSN